VVGGTALITTAGTLFECTALSVRDTISTADE
jgi:hypothetical protein